jgi:hypothetical protein
MITMDAIAKEIGKPVPGAGVLFNLWSVGDTLSDNMAKGDNVIYEQKTIIYRVVDIQFDPSTFSMNAVWEVVSAQTLRYQVFEPRE